MKTNLRIVVLFVSIILAACTKEKIVAPQPDTPEMAIARSAIEKTSESLLSGNWYVSYYVKANIDKTDSFKNYEFSFAPNGDLSAAQNGRNLAGKWVIAYIDNLTRISIKFSGLPLFIDISGDWTVVEEAAGKIKMQNVTRPNDWLSFERR